jgi:hypothetical protein
MPIEPVPQAPTLTSPDRPMWVQRAYAELGASILEWGQKWELTSAEYADLLLRAVHDRIRHVVASERQADQSRTVGMGSLGGAAELEAKPEK